MKFRGLPALLVAGAVIGLPEVAASTESPPPGGPPPLTVDTSAPLLLDDPVPDEEAAANTTTPNLICYDCHGAFREETLAVLHAKEDITCVDCHGESLEHAEDEGNVTPPKTLFARDTIGTACRECHRTHDAPAADVVVRWQQRGLEKLRPTEMVCTDCHGEHRMKVRTVHWDKKTRQLLPARQTTLGPSGNAPADSPSGPEARRPRGGP